MGGFSINQGGTGGFPQNFSYFTFYYINFAGEPPVPLVASLLPFLLSFYILKKK